tara:strand:+ start:543 stop:743 length:201 start_codon:yes stop_codon:yes gene_type:complete
MIDTDKYEEIRVLADGSTTDGRWATTKELIAEVKRLREQFKLAYDWVDTQFPDGGMADFAKYIGDD